MRPAGPAAFVLTVAVLGPHTAPVNMSRLEQTITRQIVASGTDVAVAIRVIDGGGELLIHADEPFHAASTMKVAVMIELFNQADAGRVRLDEPIAVHNEFRSIVDGTYRLNPADDSDPELYEHTGSSITARELCERMMTRSSNLATNILIGHLGVENVRKTVAALGADGMQVRRGVEDQAAFDEGLNNTTTARGLMVLMTRIAAGEAVSRAASQMMLDILSRQHIRDAIPAMLPPGVVVAHKPGDITNIHHDAGVVLGPRPFVIVVLVRGIADRAASGALIARIARDAWSEITPGLMSSGRP